MIISRPSFLLERGTPMRGSAVAVLSAPGALPLRVPRPALKEPTFAQMAANFAGAMAEWFAAGCPVASQEVQTARAATCQACELWQPEARKGLGKCNSPKCGCTKLKWWLATSKCPEGRWPE